jgi:hypothetical protein
MGIKFFSATDNEQGRPHVYTKSHSKRSSSSLIHYQHPEYPHLLEIHNDITNYVFVNIYMQVFINVLVKIN